ncbi:unnamed protein product [Moneuplotes crassus]|uniref:SSD domain-containing protein n=1 Tax=Euplotes crassus TaxID=5936 RepID=A0AAD2D3P9_EUPCR|nr:unnamed protein product [Moneuplotes crassus]
MTDLEVTRRFDISGNFNHFRNKMIVDTHMYFSARASSLGNVCRWINTTTILECISFSSNDLENFALIDTDSIFLGVVGTSNSHFYLLRSSFSDPSTYAWSKIINCPGGTGCVKGGGDSILSKDGKYIHTIIQYDSKLIFHTLSANNGDPQHSGLIENDGSINAREIVETSQYILITVEYFGPSRTKLFLINSTSHQVHLEFTHSGYKVFSAYPTSINDQEYVFLTGMKTSSSITYSMRSHIEEIGRITEMTAVSTTFAINSASTDYQIQDVSSLPSLTSRTKSISNVTNPSVITNDVTSLFSPSFKYAVSVWNDKHIQSVQSNALVYLSFTWACYHSSNVTAISFSLNQTGSDNIPDWVTLDANNQQLYLNVTPTVVEDTVYKFSLLIQFNSEQHYKEFEIIVEACLVDNCDQCKLRESDQCKTCSSGHSASSDLKKCINTEVAEGTVETAQAMILGGMVLSSGCSLVSFSSASGMFSMVNSFQLLILLPLIPQYFSEKVINFLSGMSFTMFSFDFIDLNEIPFVEYLTSWISLPQTDDYLDTLGLGSGSSIINFLPLIIVLLLLGAAHTLLAIAYGFNKKKKKRSKVRKVLTKFFVYFTFNIYIRNFIEGFLFVLLSVSSEIYAMNLSSTVAKVSFGICMFLCVCLIVFYFMSFVMYKACFSEINRSKYWYSTEFFSGIRDAKAAKLYCIMFLTLRIFIVSVIIPAQELASVYKAILFIIPNLCYAVFLCLVRPLQEIKDNIIEGINQVIFCALCVPLLWLDTENDWNSTYEQFYITTAMCSLSVGSLITLISLLLSLFFKFCKKSNKGTKVEAFKSVGQVLPKEESKSALKSEVSGKSNANFNDYRSRDEQASGLQKL